MDNPKNNQTTMNTPKNNENPAASDLSRAAGSATSGEDFYKEFDEVYKAAPAFAMRSEVALYFYRKGKQSMQNNEDRRERSELS